MPVLKAIADAGLLGNVSVITTDLYPKLVPHIESGDVVASLYQRPRSHGHLALRMLRSYLIEGRCPAYQVRLAPRLVLKSNLGQYLRQVSLDNEDQDSNPNGRHHDMAHASVSNR